MVLCQSASSNICSKSFFANVSSFSSFSTLLRKHGIEKPQPGDTGWYNRAHNLNVLFNNYPSLILALNSAIENPQNWDGTTIILQQSSIVYQDLQSKENNFSYDLGKIFGFLDFLADIRCEMAYNECFSSAVEMIGEPASRSGKRYDYKQCYFKLLITGG